MGPPHGWPSHRSTKGFQDPGGFVPGEDFRINQDSSEGADARPGCNIQSEVSLVEDHGTIVAAWNDGRACESLVGNQVHQGSANLSLNGFAWLEPGGTWDDRGTVDPIPGGNLRGDPVLAAGPDGSIYYASIGRLPVPGAQEPAPLTFGQSIIAVARADREQRRFGTPVQASIGRPEKAFHDKPWIAVDRSPDSPYTGRVYVGWTEIAENGSMTMLVARSEDGARSFFPPVALTDNTLNAFPGIQLAVGPFGDVYALWTDGPPNAHLFFARSTNGGESFEPKISTQSDWFSVPIAIGNRQLACVPDNVLPVGTPLLRAQQVLNGDIRVHSWPAMTVDISGSSDELSDDFNEFRGRIYLAVPMKRDAGDGDDADIAFMYSTDEGRTWENLKEQPERPTFVLNRDHETGGTNDQFHPAIAVDEEGNLIVSWYDRRHGDDPSDPSRTNWFIDVYARISTDGGQTFGPEIRVTDTSFPPTQTNPQVNPLMHSCYMGDYNAATAIGAGRFLLAWGDNRESDPTLGLPDPNVYGDVIVTQPTGGPPQSFPGQARSLQRLSPSHDHR